MRALDKLVDAGVDAVPVSLLWSVRNPDHEQRIVELARERHPDLFVTAAAELASQVGEYERTMAAVINSYIGPVMNGYVGGLEAGARERGYHGQILFAQCAGGTITGSARTCDLAKSFKH